MTDTLARTPRLILRMWREADLPLFAAMNADPEVTEFYPKALTREESDALAGRISEGFAARGFGLWAVEVPGVAEFAGYVGLAVPRFEAAFTPCVEVGWRLARACWGRGYATEAGREVLRDGFGRLELAEIVSFTAAVNGRSEAVMRRLGMARRAEEGFEHPLLPEEHRLRRHVLYRMKRGEFEAGLEMPVG